MLLEGSSPELQKLEMKLKARRIATTEAVFKPVAVRHDIVELLEHLFLGLEVESVPNAAEPHPKQVRMRLRRVLSAISGQSSA
jgi:hypothetical protein